MSANIAEKNDRPGLTEKPLLRLLRQAVVWAAAASLIITLVYGLWELAVQCQVIARADNASVFSAEFRSAFSAAFFDFCPPWGFRCGCVFGFVLLVLVPVRAVFLHRMAADRAFTVVGFLATFFGLAMLVVFFVTLGWNTCLWFYYTPKYIEESNKLKRAEIAQARDVKRFIENRLRETTYKEREREVKSLERKFQRKISQARDDEAQQLRLQKELAEEKKLLFDEYEEFVLPKKREELKRKSKFIVTQYPKFIREDTSPLGCLWHFLSGSPSNDPQNAGVRFAILGSLWVAVITILFAVPVGVGAALYLEEYKSKKWGWLGNIIQININNLAGVPSVVYGVLGAFVFVELVFKPIRLNVNSAIDARNLLGGGLTLGLLTLPIVIVSSQEAIRAIPQSIRSSAYALGATKWQVIWRNVLPMASPGILTGAILSISRAIGEAAPMVLFGALLYVDQSPGPFSRFTVMPMQIFNWAGQPNWELGIGSGEFHHLWQYNAALASVVLVTVLIGLNAVAIVLRNRAQRRMRE